MEIKEHQKIILHLLTNKEMIHFRVIIRKLIFFNYIAIMSRLAFTPFIHDRETCIFA